MHGGDQMVLARVRKQGETLELHWLALSACLPVRLSVSVFDSVFTRSGSVMNGTK